MRIINDIYKATCRFCLFVFFVLASCAIENDIPYPIVNAGITDIRVEGQRPAEGSSDDAALIDASAKTILLYVNDSVDISRLKLYSFGGESKGCAGFVDSALCANPNKFPFAGFASLDSIPMSSNTRVDFTKPVNFTIKTYQDYVWQVKVKQIIDRKVEAKGMIDYSIDELDNRVIIYVGKGENLKNISITSLALGGAYGEVTPNPTTVKDFTSPQKFLVQYPWSEPNKGTIWTVYVRLTDEEGGSQPSAGDLSVNAWSKYAFVEGKATEANCSFEYVKQGETSWNKVSAKADGSKVSAKIEGLQPATLINADWWMPREACWASLPSRQRLPHHYIMVISICGIKMGKHGMPVRRVIHFGIRAIRVRQLDWGLWSISTRLKEIQRLCIRRVENLPS